MAGRQGAAGYLRVRKLLKGEISALKLTGNFRGEISDKLAKSEILKSSGRKAHIALNR